MGRRHLPFALLFGLERNGCGVIRTLEGGQDHPRAYLMIPDFFKRMDPALFGNPQMAFKNFLLANLEGKKRRALIPCNTCFLSSILTSIFLNGSTFRIPTSPNFPSHVHREFAGAPVCDNRVGVPMWFWALWLGPHRSMVHYK